MSKQITETERLILLNQYEILCNTTSAANSDSYEHYKYCRNVLRKGLEYYYDEIFKSFEVEVPKYVTEKVYDILDLFRKIHNWSSCSDITHHKNFSFEGFDTHSEYNYIKSTKFIFSQGLYLELRTGFLNSNGKNSLIKYNKMLETYNLITKNRVHSVLTKDETLEILNSVPEV
jgi:uncharacterized protein YfbU (UPF0304 family)